MNTQTINHHYGNAKLLQLIDAGLTAAGKNLAALSVDDLAPVDEFHSRGREATVELAALADLGANDRLLDVGCGLGGTARHLASTRGCRVTGIDLTEQYVSVGRTLTERVGLHDRVEHRHGSALELPFAPATFEVVWTEHVQMNIPDKERFYAEVARVLKPAGRFLFHDILRGPGSPPLYPAPWAADESLSALATEDQLRSVMAGAGLEIVQWRDKTAETIAFFEKVFARIEETGAPPVGIHLLMGDTASAKLRNYLQSLRENRLSVALGAAGKRTGS